MVDNSRDDHSLTHDLERCQGGIPSANSRHEHRGVELQGLTHRIASHHPMASHALSHRPIRE
jgi:hypothetical protein